MIICKDRAILLFMLLIIYLGVAGANRKRTYRKERLCKEAGQILDNGSFTSLNEKKRKYVCRSDFVSNIPDLEKLTFKCNFERKSDAYEWKAKLTRVDILYLRNVTCERKKKCSDPPLPWNMTREITTRYLVSISSSKDRKAGNDFYTGDTLKYRCKPGFKLLSDLDTSSFFNGNDFGDYNNKDHKPPQLSTTAAPVTVSVLKDITCDAEGFWNGFPDSQLYFGECQAIQCNASMYADISNGNISNFKETYEFLDEMKLKCKDGYRHKGGVKSALCMTSSSFSDLFLTGFGCERIKCIELESPGNGYLKIDHNYVNGTVNYECESGYDLIGYPVWKCQSNGEWDHDCVKCAHKDAYCPPPCLPPGAITKASSGRYQMGDVLEFTCKSGKYYGGSTNRTCLKNRYWSGTPIDCTGTSLVDLRVGIELVSAMKQISKNRTKSDTAISKTINVWNRKGVDMYLLVDISKVKTPEKLNDTLSFVYALLPELGINDGDTGTRLVLTFFGSEPYPMFDAHEQEGLFKSYEDVRKELELYNNKNALHKIKKMTNNGTDITAALNYTYEHIKTKLEGPTHRKSQQVLMVICDGRLTSTDDPTNLSLSLKDDFGMEIYSIAIGDLRDTKGLETMRKLASHIENEQHFFKISNEESKFKQIMSSMINKDFLNVSCGLTEQNLTCITNESENRLEVNAKKNAWPWMADLRTLRSHECGGSVIKNQWILTAAHCFNHKNITQVHLGKKALNGTDGYEKYHISTIYKHDNYNKNRHEYDIALVRLSQKINWKLELRPVCLWDKTIRNETNVLYETLFTGKYGVVTGWGKSNSLSTKKHVDTLKQMQMEVKSSKECLENLKPEEKANVNTSLMFCAGGNVTVDDRIQFIDTCEGDSGGPFVVRHPADERTFIQTGIVSFGFGCKQEGKYGFYTKLTKELLDWINDTIEKVEKKAILCPTLPQIQHGSIFQDTSDGLANNYESVAEYTCDRDYYLNGNTQLRTVKRTCQSDGKWSGKEPICGEPKCNLIEDFYGGNVKYFWGRNLYSKAFYSCDENYTMIPSNVQHSTCENNLRWEPPPPKCFKNVDRYVPNDGYLWVWKRGKVSHGESYKICCNKGFEVERDNNVPVNKEECTNIRNNNGTLEPSVACVEEWCEPDRRHTEYKHEDDSEFTSRIPSNEMVWMRCKKGYAFYDNRNQPLSSPQKRRCIQGKIQDAPTCIEAKSSLVGYPYRQFTLYRDSKRNILDRKRYIEPNERIEVFCSNGYELYVEFNKVYLDEFFTTSRYGEFDKEKNKFPVCLEKRCYLNDLENAKAEYENKTQVDFSTNIQSGTYIILSCRRGFAAYDENGQALETSQKSQCVKGTIVDAPKCQEAKCSLVKYPRNLDTSYYNLNLNAPVEDITGSIESSHTINVYCKKASQYELYVEASNQYITNFRTRCKRGLFKKGKHKFPVCVKRRCVFEPSKVQGACFVTDDERNCKREEFKIHSGSSAKIKCEKGYTFFVLGKEVRGQQEIACDKGSYPEFRCTANDCTAPEVKNTKPLFKTVFKHTEKVTYKCKEGYSFSKSKLEKQELLAFESICYLGNWTTQIPESCEPASTNNVNNQQQNENEAPDDSLVEVEDYSDQIEDHSNKSKGCKISEDARYMYWNIIGDEIKPGDYIVVGDTLTVECRFTDEYSYKTFDYDYYDTHTNTTAGDITISCKDDHTMTKIHKECPEETKDERCLTIDNGNVQKSNNYYVVSCDKGFSLDIIEPEEKRSNCIDGILKSIVGGQEPKCKADPCKVPFEFDTHLSISDKFHVSLSGGSVVEVEDYVYFNCSKAGDDMQEPVNRRFKCINGQWMEDERDKSWKLGYKGDFPECRKTKCKPECQNGGVCWRDNQCKCKHFTSGKRCENGSCRHPEIENVVMINSPRTHYAIGETVRDFTCSYGHFLSSDKGMTCLNNGTWSNVITCVKGKHYLISAKTGTRPGAGIDANVYIILSGSGGSTRKIDFKGGFESGDVDEIRVFAKDIRPIHKVQIGHDGERWRDKLSNWDLEYVSIYVENMEEFYVFKNNRKQWVEKDNDLTLYREGNKTCINTFDRGDTYVVWGSANHIMLGLGGQMSLRKCKQSCVNWKDESTKKQCLSVYYYHRNQACSGFTSGDGLFLVNDRVYVKTCKHNDTL